MLRILIVIMVMTLLFAVAAVWAIFEFDLLMVKGPRFVSRREAEPKPARSRLSRGRGREARVGARGHPRP